MGYEAEWKREMFESGDRVQSDGRNGFSRVFLAGLGLYLASGLLGSPAWADEVSADPALGTTTTAPVAAAGAPSAAPSPGPLDASQTSGTPAAGTPAACPCGTACPDAACVQARAAFDTGYYPWMARSLMLGIGEAGDGSSSPYQLFLGLTQPQYEQVAEQILANGTLAFSSTFLNSVYNGPSNLTMQHLYEAAILGWLAYDAGTVDDAPKVPDALMDAVGTYWGFTADLFEGDLAENGPVMQAWAKMTGEPSGTSLGKTVGALKGLSQVYSAATSSYKLASSALRTWANINAAYGADWNRIELLMAARDAASDDPEFVAAATRVIDAYEGAMLNMPLDASNGQLVLSQVSDTGANVIMGFLWADLGADNPLLAIGMDTLNLVFSSGDVADANMGLVGTYLVGQYLRQGLSSSFDAAITAVTGGDASGLSQADSARFVRGFQAYLGYQMYALGEARTWAQDVSAHWWANQEGAQAILESCDNQIASRSSLLSIVSTYSDMFWGLEMQALDSVCACGGEACQMAPVGPGDAPTDAAQAASLYLSKINEYGNLYGRELLSSEEFGNRYYVGLCAAQLVDFDADGDNELLVVYRDRNAPVPDWAVGNEIYGSYITEIWSADGGALTCLLHTEDINGSDGGTQRLGLCLFQGKTYLMTGGADGFEYRTFYGYGADGQFGPLTSFELDDFADPNTVTVDGVPMARDAVENPLVAAYLSRPTPDIQVVWTPLNRAFSESDAFVPEDELSIEEVQAQLDATTAALTEASGAQWGPEGAAQ
ncbi:MAG: hypothetical protein KHY83_01755 [Coriobacteriia bacterium]|nr:hypothetical protein [Coriobacteriia bacterium]MBS5477376.1 hypothetical protein [Coriobacteriia bacterium]